MIKGIHHSVYRCRDSEETRRFYEDFLGLPLTMAQHLTAMNMLHTFYALGDGSMLAFFEAPDRPFEWKTQDGIDLHIALEVEPGELERWLERASAAGVPARGISDHKVVESIYLHDPNGYVVELTAKTPAYERLTDPSTNGARSNLDHWQAS